MHRKLPLVIIRDSPLYKPYRYVPAQRVWFLGLGFRPFAKSVEFAESPTQK